MSMSISFFKNMMQESKIFIIGQKIKLSKLETLSPSCRVWLQHGCCPGHHSGLHARYLPDLLQLLPGNVHTDPAAVCGPGGGNPLRRCAPAPHTTGRRHRATVPSHESVSQVLHIYRDTVCLIGFFSVSSGDPWPPWYHSQSWWRTLYRGKRVSVEDSGNDRRDLWLFPYWEDLFLFGSLSWSRKSCFSVAHINLIRKKLQKNTENYTVSRRCWSCGLLSLSSQRLNFYSFQWTSKFVSSLNFFRVDCCATPVSWLSFICRVTLVTFP